jgi:hypothetical protein
MGSWQQRQWQHQALVCLMKPQQALLIMGLHPLQLLVPAAYPPCVACDCSTLCRMQELQHLHDCMQAQHCKDMTASSCSKQQHGQQCRGQQQVPHAGPCPADSIGGGATIALDQPCKPSKDAL